jgi:hypothetical protein
VLQCGPGGGFGIALPVYKMTKPAEAASPIVGTAGRDTAPRGTGRAMLSGTGDRVRRILQSVGTDRVYARAHSRLLLREARTPHPGFSAGFLGCPQAGNRPVWPSLSRWEAIRIRRAPRSPLPSRLEPRDHSPPCSGVGRRIRGPGCRGYVRPSRGRPETTSDLARKHGSVHSLGAP